MGTSTILSRGIPQLKKLFSETNQALTNPEIADILGVTTSCSLGVLDVMRAMGILDKRKTTVFFYFLKDRYTEEEINVLVNKADEVWRQKMWGAS